MTNKNTIGQQASKILAKTTLSQVDIFVEKVKSWLEGENFYHSVICNGYTYYSLRKLIKEEAKKGHNVIQFALHFNYVFDDLDYIECNDKLSKLALLHDLYQIRILKFVSCFGFCNFDKLQIVITNPN